MSYKTVEKYFSIPYGDRILVYTNVVTLSDIVNHTFHEVLSHKRASRGKSIAMTIHSTIKKHYGNLSRKTILDVGSSIGHFSFLMAEEKAQVTGVECDPTKIKVARAIAELRGLSNVRFMQTFIEDFVEVMPLFDLALLHSVFEYVEKSKKVKVLKKLSKTCGRLYSTVLIDPQFVLENSIFTCSEKLLDKIYGSRDLWAFW